MKVQKVSSGCIVRKAKQKREIETKGGCDKIKSCLKRLKVEDPFWFGSITPTKPKRLV